MIPHIDPRVAYRGVSELRKLNAERLRDLDGLLILQENDEPLAVVVPFDLYLEIQEGRKSGE